MNIVQLRAEIPVLQSTVYLNTGTEGPTPAPVLAAQLEMLNELNAQGPAAWPMLLRVSRAISECRAAVARFINAAPAEIALTHNATEGINIVAAGLQLQPGDEVIVSDLEHASGILPWLHWANARGIRVVRLASSNGVLAPEQVAAAFTARTRLVCMSHVSYASGARLPVAEVCRLAAAKGVRVLVDGAQAVGQMAVDVQALGCDYYALPGQKWLLGPAGTGALYVRSTALETLQVSGVGWASVEDDDSAQELRLHPNAQRFELATMHGPSLAGWRAALDLLAEVGIAAIESQISKLAHTARLLLADVPGLQVLGPADPALWSGLLPFTLAGHDPKTIVKRLWHEEQVISRWIPQPYCVRLSLHAFNTEAEITRVAALLRKWQG